MKYDSRQYQFEDPCTADAARILCIANSGYLTRLQIVVPSQVVLPAFDRLSICCLYGGIRRETTAQTTSRTSAGRPLRHRRAHQPPQHPQRPRMDPNHRHHRAPHHLTHEPPSQGTGPAVSPATPPPTEHSPHVGLCLQHVRVQATAWAGICNVYTQRAEASRRVSLN